MTAPKTYEEALGLLKAHADNCGPPCGCPQDVLPVFEAHAELLASVRSVGTAEYERTARNTASMMMATAHKERDDLAVKIDQIRTSLIRANGEIALLKAQVVGLMKEATKREQDFVEVDGRWQVKCEQLERDLEFKTREADRQMRERELVKEKCT